MSVEDLLKALAESDREREAPASVELRLRSAFRGRYARPKWPYFAAAAAAVILFSIARPKPHISPQVSKIEAVMRPAPVIPMAVPRKVVHRRRPPQEIVTEFFPLMDDAPPFERGELLRVSLPASAMRSVGVPVSEDRLADMVQADVLVGEEGLARAIRFINRP